MHILMVKPSKFALILQSLFQKINQATVAEWFKAPWTENPVGIYYPAGLNPVHSDYTFEFI